MSKSFKILSFGGGVQSVTIAVMACKGSIVKPDYAIFADPQWETKATYDYMDWFEGWMKDRGLTLIKRTAGNIREKALDNNRWASMPLFTLDENGKKGMLRRQCTNDFKIQVVYKAIRDLLGIPKYGRVKVPVEVWLGITMDEAQRMKDSRVKWAVNKYPLIDLGYYREYLTDNMFSGANCIDYLKQHNIPIPPKSACIGCPFHSDDFWFDLKHNSPEEFEDACQFDDAVRNSTRKGVKSLVFIHRSRQPLRDVDFKTDTINHFNEECEGHCGL